MNENNNTGQQGLKAFAEAEKARLDQERQQRMEEGGYKPFFKFPVGTTRVVFSEAVAPRVNEKYHDNKIFRAVISGAEYDLSIKMNSPLYRMVIDSLVAGHYTVDVSRVGTDQDNTRYGVTPIGPDGQAIAEA